MKKLQLRNGLRVVLEKIPTCRSVSFGIWVKTGSRNENETTNGISHFIEHMLFKGTERFDAQAIAESFDAIGGNVNAFTSKEYTCYYAKVLDEHLPIAVDVLSDMFFRSNFDPSELDKEKNVILEEIAMYDDTPDDTVHDLVTRAAYGSHPLAYPILGTEERLQPMKAEHLRQYMKQHYSVANTVVAVAGNFDDSIIELLENHFGHYHNDHEEQQYDAPAFHSDLLYHEKKTEQNHICLSLPGCSMTDPRLYAMIILNNVIGGGMSSRLFQEIREKRGLAYSVYSYHSSHADSGLFTVYAGTAPKQTTDVLNLTLEVLEGMTAKGLTSDELMKGKEQLKGSLILSLESTGSRMNRLGKNELMVGRHYTLDEIIARIEAVTMDDVDHIIKQMVSKPFAVSMVGANDQAISAFRRDYLVASDLRGTN
ncbi:insulinase family protein [Paenibacillus sp. ACRRX]|uniref:M16 family metallopeptidase n=1 Tax=unclassified Paenibacillus TaxID=185978 RepID=UPI001EF620AC|nr:MULTISPECIES: pitrilysin family protein [unclassified Paenibacillus]MCG7407442.1 insulinase family protein [Paenibacillus sp. ACRRX]MDK8180677.1 pitrilysin family protein [Paenibacillus sp. UMB4589-SE434]